GHDRFSPLSSGNSATVFVRINKLFYRQAQFNFINAGFVDISAGGNEFGPRTASDPDLGIFVSPMLYDPAGGCNGFHIVYHRGTSPYARNRRERGLDPRVSTLPFQRFNQGGFFPADIRAATGLHVKFQVVSAPQNVLSEEAFFPRFGNGLFQYPDHVEQFSPDVYIRSVRAQRETGNDHAFNEGMWVADHEVAVFECPRFAFIRV